MVTFIHVEGLQGLATEPSTEVRDMGLLLLPPAPLGQRRKVTNWDSAEAKSGIPEPNSG